LLIGENFGLFFLKENSSSKRIATHKSSEKEMSLKANKTVEFFKKNTYTSCVSSFVMILSPRLKMI